MTTKITVTVPHDAQHAVEIRVSSVNKGTDETSWIPPGASETYSIYGDAVFQATELDMKPEEAAPAPSNNVTPITAAPSAQAEGPVITAKASPEFLRDFKAADWNALDAGVLKPFEEVHDVLVFGAVVDGPISGSVDTQARADVLVKKSNLAHALNALGLDSDCDMPDHALADFILGAVAVLKDARARGVAAGTELLIPLKERHTAAWVKPEPVRSTSYEPDEESGVTG